MESRARGRGRCLPSERRGLCPLPVSAARRTASSCARAFAPRFFQTSPRRDAFALRYTSRPSRCEEDLHLLADKHARHTIKTGRRLGRKHLPAGVVVVVLVVELQSELDLPRIVRSVAGGADFAESRAVIVERVRDGNDAVAAKARGVEVRVIGDVEE